MKIFEEGDASNQSRFDLFRDRLLHAHYYLLTWPKQLKGMRSSRQRIKSNDLKLIGQDSPPNSLMTAWSEAAKRKTAKPFQTASASAGLYPAGGRSQTM